jgi:glycosyltransferase involved in cell wall biosynthesis
MGDPLVSIITPVLNRVETMGASLGSVTRQTYRSIDRAHRCGWGSTDGTLELLREYLASYPLHWVSEPRLGAHLRSFVGRSFDAIGSHRSPFGRAKLAEAIRAITWPTRGFDTRSAVLRFLRSGRVPEDPTELITSAIVGRVISALRRSPTSC